MCIYSLPESMQYFYLYLATVACWAWWLKGQLYISASLQTVAPSKHYMHVCTPHQSDTYMTAVIITFLFAVIHQQTAGKIGFRHFASVWIATNVEATIFRLWKKYTEQPSVAPPSVGLAGDVNTISTPMSCRISPSYHSFIS